MNLEDLIQTIQEYLTDSPIGESLALNIGIWDASEMAWYATLYRIGHDAPVLGESSYGSPSIEDALTALVAEIKSVNRLSPSVQSVSKRS